MTRFLTALCLAFLALTTSANAQSAILQKSDAVITGFPGTAINRDFNKNSNIVDETVIDLNGASVRLKSLSNPTFVWDGRSWQAPQPLTIPARKIGLVFGIALDDEQYPNTYFTATSVFGLNITIPDNDQDGHRERTITGHATAKFMAGQWGTNTQSGAGSVWKLDGKTGQVTLFANITLNGTANSGASLGNITYNATHKQLIISDRNTGLIHILDLAGNEVDIFDHGVTARTTAGLSPVPFDTTNRLDITSDDFDAEDTDTWAFAAPRRATWGLAVNNGRLYYAVARGETSRQPQIWSVGLDPKTGLFLNDARWELSITKDVSSNEISDIVFTKQGAMILAQRGKQTPKYDFSKFAKAKKARVLRYWLEKPNDPNTPSAWIAEPEEYAIGFKANHRNTNGGIALGYGYTNKGQINSKVCQASLWSTGNSLRSNASLNQRLLKGGSTNVVGIQGSPTRPVRNFNTPPWASYFVDFDGRFNTPEKVGQMGDIEIYTPDCATRSPSSSAPETPYYTAWNYPESNDWTYPEEVPPSCTWENGCIKGPPPEPEFDVKKTCNYCQTDPKTGKLKCQCQIKVSSNGVPFIDPYSISDALTIGNGTITAISSVAPWACTTTPTAQCSITSGGFDSLNNSSAINVDVEFDNLKDMESAKNCAKGSGPQAKESCTTFGGVKVEKKMKSEHCEFGTSCSYEITVTNLSSTNPYNAPVTIVDQMTGATMAITSIAPSMCNPEPTQAPFACIANVNLAPGASITYTITGMQVPTGGYGTGNVEVSNCASTAPPPEQTTGQWWADFINATPTNQSCAKHITCAFSCHMKDTSDLAVKKELKSENCTPGGLCTYTITMTNTGTAPRNGPFSLVDDMPTGASLISVTGLPWTCAPNAVTPANDLVCKYPPSIPLAGGASISFDVTISIPAAFAGTEITNCIGFDLKPLSGSSAQVGKQIASLPTMQSSRAKASNPEANLARYFINRGLGDKQSQKLAQKVFKQAISGDLATDREKSCVTVPVGDTPQNDDTDSSSDDSEPFDIKITKSSTPGGPVSRNFLINVSQVSGVLKIGDVLIVTDTVPPSATFTSINAPTGWSCTPATIPPVLSAGQTLSCSYTVSSNGPLSSIPALTIGVPASLTIQNCATVEVRRPGNPEGLPETNTANNTACASINANNNPDTGNDTSGKTPKIAVTKTCLPVKRNDDTETNDSKIFCSIKVTGTNLQNGGTIKITELSKVIGRTTTILSSTPITPPLTCGSLPVNADTAVDCTLTSDALISAGGTLTFNVTLDSINPNWIKMDHGQNCATASYTSSNATVTTGPESCTKYTLEPEAQSIKIIPPVIPPIIKTPRCDKRTTYKKGSSCACRFGRAKKTSPTTCACPRGTKLNAKRGRCQKILRCIKPAKVSRSGKSCLCPRGWRPNGKNGCRKAVICKKPARVNRTGNACLCPRGWRSDGRNGCKKPRVIRLCVPPARPAAGARGCYCPKGWRKTSPFTCGPSRPRPEHPRPRQEGPKKDGFIIKPFG